MKLEDIKDKIDSFFDNITPEELYDMAVNKYGFKDITYDVEDEFFQT